MTDLVSFLQNLTAVAFTALGVAAVLAWYRRRDASLGYLVLAIVLLCLVDVVSRVPVLLGFTPPLLTEFVFGAFIASAYALLRYRDSLIPIRRGWHIAAVAAVIACSALFFGSEALAVAGVVPAGLATVAALALLLLWAVIVSEPIVRFWLVSNRVTAVQRWRLRMLSLGFGLIIVVFAVVLGASVVTRSLGVQVGGQLALLAIVPILYASCAPPAWLRREWRAGEEEDLRDFMERLLISDQRETMLASALDWVVRLTGGAGAVAMDARGEVFASRGIDASTARELATMLPSESRPVMRISVPGIERGAIVIPIRFLADEGRLAILPGPFTPGLGGDEINRVQQFMSAVATGLDRQRLIRSLSDTNERLDKANRYKSIFLANMSHELRTPLNAIIGFSELLLDATDGQFEIETRRRFLAQIHAGGKHLLGLINDILDLSKIEAGQMELRLEMVGVADVLADVMRIVEPLAALKHIKITLHPGPPRRASVDPGKLKQMILNLVSNAIKFTAEGGHVTVDVRWLDDTFEIAVGDSGIGIAVEDQSRIFEEFQQVDSGAGRANQGTGLGLTLTRRFAHLHGGEVEVRSRLGGGSTFTLSLPIKVAEPTNAAPQRGATLPLPRPTGPLVLVVEDNLSAAELVAHNLARGGFQTTLATNGRDALAKARELKPIAITLDVMLPELDGWEVLARLKRDPETADIPVVIVSVIDNRELGIALGAMDYFVKPVEAAALVRCVSRYSFKRRGAGDECRVMVVDDEAANRDLLKQILEPVGFEVVLAGGGQEAIRLAEKLPPDLVLLDLVMPDVSGFDVVERLRDRAATRSIPIIVLTAKDLTEEDKAHLTGRVSSILARRSTGATDLLSQVHEVLVHRAVPA